MAMAGSALGASNPRGDRGGTESNSMSLRTGRTAARCPGRAGRSHLGQAGLSWPAHGEVLSAPLNLCVTPTSPHGAETPSRTRGGQEERQRRGLGAAPEAWVRAARRRRAPVGAQLPAPGLRPPPHGAGRLRTTGPRPNKAARTQWLQRPASARPHSEPAPLPSPSNGGDPRARRAPTAPRAAAERHRARCSPAQRRVLTAAPAGAGDGGGRRPPGRGCAAGAGGGRAFP